MTCPGCAAATTGIQLESRLGRPIAVDACTRCGTFWFDELESPQLSESNRSFGANEAWWKEAGSAGLVEAGHGALMRLMKKA